MEATAQPAINGAKRVLGLDSALAGCSAAVLIGDRIVSRRFETMVRGHAEALLPMVRSVVAEAGLGFADFELIAVTVGPGHFTGLRVGIAAAQGLAIASGIPLAGVTTLEAIAEAAAGDGPLVVALETKRADLYLQTFLGRDPCSEPAAVPPERISAGPWPEGVLRIAGDGAPRLEEALHGTGRIVTRSGPELPDAAAVARIAARRHGTLGSRPAEPLYLRPPDVTLPKRPQQ